MDTWDISPDLIEHIPFNRGVRTLSPKRIDPFILGPFPLWWLKTAATECGPSAVLLGLELFYRQGLKVPPKPIRRSEAESWGMTRNTRDAALRKLMEARLIRNVSTSKRFHPQLDLETRKPPQKGARV